MSELPPTALPPKTATLPSDALPALTLEILGAAKRDVIIMSQRLDPNVYDSAKLVESLIALIKRRQDTGIRILIAQVEPLRFNGHHLLTLAQDLPSFVTIRLQAPRAQGDQREFLIVDESTVIYRDHSDQPEFAYHTSNRPKAIELANEFQSMWDQSEGHPDLRRLSI